MAHASLQFLLNPSPPAYTAQMQSPDDDDDRHISSFPSTLRVRIRKARDACYLLAAKLHPRFEKAFPAVKDMLHMDDMTNWPLLAQAGEWEAKIDFLKELDAANPERANPDTASRNPANPDTAGRTPLAPVDRDCHGPHPPTEVAVPEVVEGGCSTQVGKLSNSAGASRREGRVP
jgi:hypothetical protein